MPLNKNKSSVFEYFILNFVYLPLMKGLIRRKNVFVFDSESSNCA